MTAWTYKKGLHDLGAGLWAYLQPDGGRPDIAALFTLMAELKR